jgi:sugar phosphate isomerase/epimerase
MKLGMIKNDCTREGFEYVKSKGLEFIEICCNYSPDVENFISRKDEVKSLIAETGIPILSMGRWNGEGGPIDDKGGIKQDLFAEAKRVIDTCSEIGCPVYNCGCNLVEGLSLFRNYDAAIKYLGQLIDYATPKGVKIATYNCHWNSFTDNSKAWEVIHGELPALGIKFDASHSINGGRDYYEEIKNWGHRFYHMHIKGSLNVNGKHVDDPPAGLDMINWRAILGMVYWAGYEGNLSLEPHSNVWNGDLGERGLYSSIRYIKSLLV